MSWDTDGIRRQLIADKRRAVELAEREMKRRLDRNVPVKTKELKESIQFKVSHRNEESIIDVKAGGPNIPQAETTEKGARPHVIVPKRANALTFYWPKAGRVVSLKKVNHPGNPPRPWFQPTMNEWRKVIENAWNVVTR